MRLITFCNSHHIRTSKFQVSGVLYMRYYLAAVGGSFGSTQLNQTPFDCRTGTDHQEASCPLIAYKDLLSQMSASNSSKVVATLHCESIEPANRIVLWRADGLPGDGAELILRDVAVDFGSTSNMSCTPEILFAAPSNPRPYLVGINASV